MTGDAFEDIGTKAVRAAVGAFYGAVIGIIGGAVGGAVAGWQWQPRGDSLASDDETIVYDFSTGETRRSASIWN